MIRVHFYFILIFLLDRSRSELIPPEQAVWVDPVWLLYLPIDFDFVSKTNMKPTYSHFEWTSFRSLKDLLLCIWPKGELFLAGPTWEVPSVQDGPIFARSCSPSECRIHFILPARRFSHIINPAIIGLPMNSWQKLQTFIWNSGYLKQASTIKDLQTPFRVLAAQFKQLYSCNLVITDTEQHLSTTTPWRIDENSKYK